jgi:hypothetical protein
MQTSDVFLLVLVAIIPVMFYKGRDDKNSLYRKWGYALLLSVAVAYVYSELVREQYTRLYCSDGSELACLQLETDALASEMRAAQ